MFRILERRIDIWTPPPRLGTCSSRASGALCRTYAAHDPLACGNGQQTHRNTRCHPGRHPFPPGAGMPNREVQIVTENGVSRRSLFRAAGVGAAVAGGGALLEACSSSIQGASSSASTSASASSSTSASASTSSTAAASGEITIGWIHPATGGLAGFGVPDQWVVETIMKTPQYQNGMKIGGTTYTVNIKLYDTQSS